MAFELHAFHCPVCRTYVENNIICPECGYDLSCEYSLFLTLGEIDSEHPTLPSLAEHYHRSHTLDGFAERTYSNGNTYIGELENGNKTGFGKFTWTDGRVYEGTWTNNKRDGFGKIVYKAGDSYIGEWKNDRKNGHGAQYDANGKLIRKGLYVDGKCVEEF